MRKLHVFIFFLLFFSGFSKAQDKTEGAPVTIEISSKYLSPGQEYTLSGQTETGNKSLSVKIEILSGASVLETEEVKTDAAGKYGVTRKAPAGKGFYQAKATGADGKNSDTISFAVVSPVGVGKALAEHFSKPVAFALKGLEVADIIVSNLPLSTAREEFKEKYVELAGKLSGLREQSAEMQTEFVRLMEVLNGHPSVAPETEECFNELQDQIDEMQKEVTDFSWKLSQESQDITSTCDNLDFAIEAIGFASSLLNIESSLAMTVANFASNELITKALDGTVEDEDYRFVAQTTLNAATQVSNPVKLVLGVLLDLGKYVSQKTYDHYCEEMKGPFSGKFYAEFDAGEGMGVWEKYSMDMKGELTLRYDKDGNSKTGFTVTGEFKGAYTNYDFWADVNRVETLPPGIYIIDKRVIYPNSSYFPDREISFGRAEAIAPGNFRVKVKGVIKNDKLLLKFDDKAVINNIATFNKEFFRLIITAVNPALPIPLINVFSFPVAPARSVFVVGMGNEGQVFDLKDTRGKSYEQSKIENTGRRISAKKKFENERNISNNEIRLKTTLDVYIETEDYNEQ